MTDDRSDQNETRIQPSVRWIGRLSRGARDTRSTRFGVLPDFFGLLAGRRPRRSGERRPGLSYLTLEPLVTAGLSGGDGGTSNGTDRTGERDGESGRFADDPGREGERERLTVREYLRRERTDTTRQEATDRRRSTESTPTAPDSGTEDGDERSGGDDGDDAPSAGDRPLAPEPGRTERLTVVERWRRPPSETDRRPDAAGGERSVGDRSVPVRPERRPSTPADEQTVVRSDSSGDAERATRVDRGPDGTARPPARPDRDPATPGDPGGSDGPGEPPLVVRESGSPGRPGGTADDAGGQTGRGPAHEHATGGRRTVGTRPPATARSDEPGPPEAGRDADGNASPLSFDGVADPAFDRFVETLARRLERRERIERERRGL